MFDQFVILHIPLTNLDSALAHNNNLFNIFIFLKITASESYTNSYKRQKKCVGLNSTVFHFDGALFSERTFKGEFVFLIVR